MSYGAVKGHAVSSRSLRTHTRSKCGLPSRFSTGASLRYALLVSVLGIGVAAAHAQPLGLQTAKSTANRYITPIAVFGSDERRPLPPARGTLADKIGVLAIGEANFCTAFCVGSDAIATASHCLLGTEQTPGPDLERVVFKVGHGIRNASRLAGDDPARVRAGLQSGTTQLRIKPPIAAVNDWAIARLDKPVCRGGGLPVAVLSRETIEERSAHGDVYQVAMHRDVSPDALVLAAPCQVLSSFPQAGEKMIAQDFIEPRSVLMHTCDTGPGSSGSPLLIDGENGPQVIGLNVGTYVLSRSATSTSTGSPKADNASEAIANTAIDSLRFKAAVELFVIETSAIGTTAKRGDKR